MVALQTSVLLGFVEFSKNMKQTFAEANVSIEFRKKIVSWITTACLTDWIHTHTHLAITDYRSLQSVLAGHPSRTLFLQVLFSHDRMSNHPTPLDITYEQWWYLILVISLCRLSTKRSRSCFRIISLTMIFSASLSISTWAPFPFDVMRRYQLRCKAQGTGTELLEGLGHLGVVHPTVGGLWVGAKMS